MSFFRRIISPQLAPNTRWSDILFSLYAVLNPFQWFRWKVGSASVALHSAFKEYHAVTTAISFDSGRTALQAIIRALQLEPGDSVAIQAFTCIVVPNSIIAAGARPYYVDIDNSYNIDVEQLEAALEKNPHIKAVVVQHTFGIPADIERIQALCTERDIWLIEDCAHSLGATVNGKRVGTFGDAAMFSFGRDKVISSISGGMAITSNDEIESRLKQYHNSLPLPSRFWIFQRLNYPFIFAIAKAVYTCGLGKALIAFTRALHLWPLVLEPSEKKGIAPTPYQLPNILAQLAMLQFAQLDERNLRRKSIAKSYLFALSRLIGDSLTHQAFLPNSRPIFLRFSFTIADSRALLDNGKKHDILLGDWYKNSIDPKGSDFAAVGYTLGSCPEAERIAQDVINLPTHTNMNKKDVHRVIQYIQDQLGKKA